MGLSIRSNVYDCLEATVIELTLASARVWIMVNNRYGTKNTSRDNAD